MPRPDRSAVVAEAKARLEAIGRDLAGPCGAFAITSYAAWLLREEGAGVLEKSSGTKCLERAIAILAYRDGEIYDVLIAAGTENRPAWQFQGSVEPARWRPPPLPPLDVEPGPPPPPTDWRELLTGVADALGLAGTSLVTAADRLRRAAERL